MPIRTTYFTPLLIWLFWFVLVHQISTAGAQKASPTGGGWLHLQTPDFATLALAPPNKTLDVELQGRATFETWFYARRPVPTSHTWILFGKDNSYRFYLHHMIMDDVMRGRIETYFAMTGSKGPEDQWTPITYVGKTAPSLNEWHHVAFVIVEPGRKNGGILFLDGKAEGRFHALPVRPSKMDFFMGGVDLDIAIEEARISNIARYLSNFQPPFEPFEPDDHTMALWHFDERADATVFADASGNGNTLAGHNGARIVRGRGKLTPPEGLFVRPRDKMALTWGRIKTLTR